MSNGLPIGHTYFELLAKTYIRPVCADTGYSLENEPEVMDDWNG